MVFQTGLVSTYVLKDYGSITYCSLRLLGVRVTFAYAVSPLSFNGVGGGVLYTMVTGRLSTLQLVPFEFHCWLGLQTKGKHRYTELLLTTSRPIVPRVFEVSKVRMSGQCCFLTAAQDLSINF